jgi:hypothetical protein
MLLCVALATLQPVAALVQRALEQCFSCVWRAMLGAFDDALPCMCYRGVKGLLLLLLHGSSVPRNKCMHTPVAARGTYCVMAYVVYVALM